MKDTIYREDAIKAINAKLNWYQVTCNGKQIAVMLMAKDVNEILEKVPSADRPQGAWIRASQKKKALERYSNVHDAVARLIAYLQTSALRAVRICARRVSK